MKKKITGLLVILAIMAVIPLVFSKNKIQFDAESVFQNPNSGKTALITSAAAFHFRENYSDETMKALILILNSNYKAGKLNKKETISKNEFLKKHKNGKIYYSKIENNVRKLSDNYITYKNKAVYIPLFNLSKGFTEKDRKYPYLKSRACPWDVTEKGFNKNAYSTGISVNSLNKLCENGISCENALKQFLDI